MVGRVGARERAAGGRPSVTVHTRRGERLAVCSTSVNAAAADAAAALAERAAEAGGCALLAFEEVTRGASCI
jgi:hypothetical protein